MLISRSYRLRHLPLRLATGAYILNSGINKRGLSGESAEQLQSGAAKVAPFVKEWEPEKFGRVLSSTEITLGSALLAPCISSRLVGAGLAAFSTGLLTMYVRTPEMREPGSLRPSQQGSSIAKDSWMLGIGLSLLIDSCRRRK